MQTRIELPGSIAPYLLHSRTKLSRLERAVIHWAMVDDHHSLLEIACEQDRLISYYQRQYHIRACGLCFDIDIARKLRSEMDNAEIMSSLNGDIPWKNDSFDRIIMTNSLPYYLSIHDFLSEIFRVLAPGGKLVFTLGSMNLYRCFPTERFARSSRNYFLKKLENLGFKDVSCNTTMLLQSCLIAHKIQ